MSEPYLFAIKFTETILNYGPLGLAFGGLFTLYVVITQFDLKKRKK